MAVFYWNNNGRLGNLLFQYAAILRYTTADDRVYSFRHEAIDLLTIDDRFKLIPGTGRVVRKLNFHLNALARLAVRQKWVGSVKPQSRFLFDTYLSEADEVLTVEGPIFRHHFILQGYFQFGRLWEVPIRIKPELTSRAKRRLLATTRRTAATVAVHIRLTDYGAWSVLGHAGTLIAPAWYQERMNEVRRRLHAATFVVFSDDLSAARQLVFGPDVVYFQGDSPAEDFAAMALCDHAIISPSSFGWWAASVFKRRDKIVMAPEYWAGFKSRTWYPPTIQTDGLEYYRVR